jgi:protocatechuate 3,4-dioxygenase beta subunit
MESSPRLRAITERLVEQVCSTLVEFEVDEDELMQALAFLTEVGREGQSILLSDVLGISVAANNLSHAGAPGATPANVQGPLYRPGAPRRPAPVALCAPEEPGIPLHVSGRVISAVNGRPAPGARLDVWQASHAGRYENEDATQPDFNLRGRFEADAEGHYAFRTVIPGAYHIAGDGPVARLLAALGRQDWRPGHLHVKVEAGGFAPLTTQLYMPEDPWLGADAIGAVKPALVVTLAETGGAGASPGQAPDQPSRACRFDFALTPLPG